MLNMKLDKWLAMRLIFLSLCFLLVGKLSLNATELAVGFGVENDPKITKPAISLWDGGLNYFVVIGYSAEEAGMAFVGSGLKTTSDGLEPYLGVVTVIGNNKDLGSHIQFILGATWNNFRYIHLSCANLCSPNYGEDYITYAIKF